MVSMVMLFYVLVSFAYGYFLSLYPGKRSKKHGQSFAEHAISFPARSAECHYCDVSLRSARVLPFLNLIGEQRICCS